MPERQSFRDNALFAGLDDASVAAIADVGTVRTYEHGETIFSEGDEGTHVFCVLEGRVEITVNLGTAVGEAPVHVCPEGSVFGEFVLFQDHVRTATARSVKPVKMFAATREELESVFADDPAAGYKVMNNLCHILVRRICKTTRDLRASLTW